MRKAADAMFLTLALILGFAPALTAQEGAPDCTGLTESLLKVQGYELTAPAAGIEDGWCVLNGVTLRSALPGWPNLSVEELRLRRDGGEDAPWIEIALTGLRITPRIGDTAIDDRLRALFRLQRIDLWLVAVRHETDDRLELRLTELRLSGDRVLSLEADIAGGTLDPSAAVAGAVRRLDLEWRNDGRVLRPVMELAGAELSGAEGGAAVDAARAALAGIVAALPETALAEDTRDELEELVAALPQGRGRLALSFVSDDGIGAARVALAALSGELLGPDSLARLLDGAVIEADWQPGLTP
jgi:hypothetical protein